MDDAVEVMRCAADDGTCGAFRAPSFEPPHAPHPPHPLSIQGLLVPAAGQILPAVTDREAVGKRRVVAAAVGEGVPEMRWPPEQEHQ